MTAEYTAVILSAPLCRSNHRPTRVRLCTNVFHHTNIIIGVDRMYLPGTSGEIIGDLRTARGLSDV